MSTPEKPVVEPQRPLSWAERAVFDEWFGPAADGVSEATRRAIRDGLYAARTASVTGLDGASLIAAERRRQITVERYDADHDRGHGDELAQAAAVYATPPAQRVESVVTASGGPDISDRAYQVRVADDWPWHPAYYKPTPDDRLRELVKAGALIAAAIDAEQGSAPSIEQEPGEDAWRTGLRLAYGDDYFLEQLCGDDSWDSRYACVKPKGHQTPGPGLTDHDYRNKAHPSLREQEPGETLRADLCPACGHHVHRPAPCQWTFGAGRNETACPCAALEADPQETERPAFTGQMDWPCTCGHPKSDHYFGDGLDMNGQPHTSCQRSDGCHRFTPAIGNPQ